MIKCTVAIPVFNRRKLVRAALESALAQNINGLEVLVVDNCSDDGTWEVLQSCRDPRVRLVRNDRNLGLFGNFNRCLELARGDYLRFLCSDDRLTPGCLEEEIRIMEAHPDVVLLSTAGRFVDESGNPCEPPMVPFGPGIYPGEQAICSWFWFFSHYGYNPLNYPSGVLFRLEAARRAGEFYTTMRLAGDINFYLRVLQLGKLAVTDRVGCEIMLHAGQEQANANLDGSAMREHFANVERYRDLLQGFGYYRSVRRHLAGVVLSAAWYYRRRGLAAAEQAHVEIVRSAGVPPLAAGLAMSSMYLLRLLFKATGFRMTRLPSAKPLRA